LDVIRVSAYTVPFPTTSANLIPVSLK
jgi:hypothetical protein